MALKAIGILPGMMPLQVYFDLMGIDVKRCNTPEEVAPTVDAALYAAFASEQKIAILLSQRLIGRKEW